ncbi:MAG: hypothetical protein R3A10_23490 [Caldilineaceae bacterium]
MGANVTVLDINHDRLQYPDDVFHGRLQTRTSNEYNIEQAVFNADLVIGAVLIPGGRAPWLVTRPCWPRCATAASSWTWRWTRAAASRRPGPRPTAIPPT